MNILHIASGELAGGAAKGTFLLHQAQQKLGIKSTLLISAKNGLDDPSVLALGSGSQRRFVELAIRAKIGNLPLLFYSRKKPGIFNTGFSGFDFTQLSCYKKADLVHLHWINGFVSIPILRKIKKPIVWTIRDMWPLTGGCHYSMLCNRYIEGCGKCPQLNSNFKYDVSSLVVSLKRKCLPAKLQPVGISEWIMRCS